MAFTLEREQSLYDSLRKEFVEGVSKPAFKDLAQKYDIPLSTVYWRASEENWHEARAAHLQQKAKESEANAIIEQAASRVDQRVIRAFSDVLVQGLAELSRTVGLLSADENMKVSGRTNILNTVSFAFLNFANGSKAVGLVSFEKHLDKLGKEANGRWDKDFFSQININIGKAAAEVEAQKAAKPTEVRTEDLHAE